jgi:anti-anti-sigma regulatory factor
MKVVVYTGSEMAILQVHGSLDSSSIEKLESVVSAQPESARVLLDLARTSHIDSTGLAAILAFESSGRLEAVLVGDRIDQMVLVKLVTAVRVFCIPSSQAA